jgi:hypothetical protein
VTEIKAEPFFKVDLSDGAHLSFDDIEQIGNWIQSEQAAFQWLNNGAQEAGVGPLREEYRSGWNNLAQYLQKWRNDQNDTQAAQSFLNVFQGTYSSPRLVRSTHEFARIASAVANKDGGTAASAALAFLLGIPCNINFETIKGVFAALLNRNGIDPGSTEIVSKAIADLNKVASQERILEAGKWDNLRVEAAGLLEVTKGNFDKNVAAFEARTSEVIDHVNGSVNASVNKIRDTDAAFREQMTLQAPVEYWNVKADSHRNSIRWSRRRLIGFAVFGSAALMYSLYWLAAAAAEIAERTKVDTPIYLKFAIIGAVITTIFFWIGRVLLRIYLSDRHLLTDAEERVAMIKTYLALTNDKKVEPSDRALILAPIFRTAADGIVKEEGPDASLAGVIARLIDVKGGR